MNKPIAVILFCVCISPLLCFCACNRAPDGFPKVVPCTITLTNKGKPVDGAFIQVDTVPPTSSLSITAKTDANGQATLQTYLGTYGQPGIPVGSVVLFIQKDPLAEDFKSEEERAAMSYDEGMKYSREMAARSAKLPRIVPVNLTKPATSPLKRDVVAGKPINWEVKLEDYR